jgi:hypothetical protein
LSTDKAERMELYKDRNVQLLLDKFLNGEVSEIEPVYESGQGYSFPIVESIVGGHFLKAEAFLERLFRAGIFQRRLVDKVVFCPKCDSANVSVRYCCPYCRSYDIRKSSLIEHVKCGYMDVEDNFLKSGRLVCQKCNSELKKPNVDYRRAGIWCTCGNCAKSFDIPVTSLICRDCGESFSFEDALIKDVYSYAMSDEARQEVSRGWVLIAPLRELLLEKEFEVEAPAFLKGKSGANHMFDIVARKGKTNKKVTVIDLAISSKNVVSEQPVIALFAKIFDVSPDNAYLIAVPKISENAKKMAELYHIQLVDAKNQNEAVKALKEKMK